MKKLTHNQCIVQTDYWTWMISLLNMFLLTSKTNEMGYIYGKFIICLFDLSNYSTLTRKHVAYKHHLEALKLLYYIFFWNYVGWEWINHSLYWTGFCLCFGSWSYSFDKLKVHPLLPPSWVCVCASKMRNGSPVIFFRLDEVDYQFTIMYEFVMFVSWTSPHRIKQLDDLTFSLLDR